MGTYVYKVTSEKNILNGVEVNVMKFAYKPYLGDEKLNAQMAFGSQCWRSDKYVQTDDFTGKVSLGGNEWIEYPAFRAQAGIGTMTDSYFDDLLSNKKKFRKIMDEEFRNQMNRPL